MERMRQAASVAALIALSFTKTGSWENGFKSLVVKGLGSLESGLELGISGLEVLGGGFRD